MKMTIIVVSDSQLHYLVVSAFAWMLVEAANMYQLLITVFASAETHFMAKRVFAAWGELLFLIPQYSPV